MYPNRWYTPSHTELYGQPTAIRSLVCIDRSEDIGVIVNSYNEITKNVSGQVLEKWSEREKWALDKLTANGNLPLDVIEVAEVSKILY